MVQVWAGLIDVSLAQGEPESIRDLLEEALAYLANDPIGIDHLTYVYAVCYRALKTLNDARATDILLKGRDFIESRTALIDDERLKRTYCENIPPHHELLQEAERVFGN